jgi:hypothetical protein
MNVAPITVFGYARRQWSFPLPLPLPLLGIFGAQALPLSGGDFPWSDELDHACLAEYIGAAPYTEVRLHTHLSRGFRDA